MSEENVRVVAAAYEALANGGISAFSDYWSEDIEWRTMRERWVAHASEYATQRQAVEAVGLKAFQSKADALEAAGLR